MTKLRKVYAHACVQLGGVLKGKSSIPPIIIKNSYKVTDKETKKYRRWFTVCLSQCEKHILDGGGGARVPALGPCVCMFTNVGLYYHKYANSNFWSRSRWNYSNILWEYIINSVTELKKRLLKTKKGSINTDTPLWKKPACGKVEDIYQFFFSCTLTNQARLLFIENCWTQMFGKENLHYLNL